MGGYLVDLAVCRAETVALHAIPSTFKHSVMSDADFAVILGAWSRRYVVMADAGLKTALKAFASFHSFNPNSRFVIAGEGPLKDPLAEMARELGVHKAVELRGFLDQSALAELYAQSHVFVHPSELTKDQNQEGVPNSMLEAMATGLPVLATQHGGIPEAVTHGTHGLLVPEGDHEAE